MITTKGKAFLKQYLAGTAASSVGALSLGIGSTAAALGDTRMQFEWARVAVDLIAYDFVADKLIFKGALPDNIEGKIYEVGMWTHEVNSQAGSQDSRIISTFDSAVETFDVGTWVTTNTRIGADSLRLAPALSTTSTSNLIDLQLDLSNSSSSDLFSFAFYNGANLSSLKFRFMTDASNYYEYTLAGVTASAYNIITATKGSATVVGVPDWQNITQLQIAAAATGAGAAAVDLDGIRLEDVDTVSPDFGLVARYIPATPIVKTLGSIQDFEYALGVTL